LFVVLIGLTTFNNNHIFPVFNVDIVGPLETEKPQPKISPPPDIARKPLVRKAAPRPFLEKLPPDAMHDDEGVPSSRAEDAHISSKPEGDDRNLKGKPEGTGVTGDNGTAPSPPLSLFDRDTIEKYARKEPPPGKGLTFDTSEFRHRGYMRLLKEKIEGVWQYPKNAASLGLSGDLYMKFTIKKDGTVSEVELLRTSGYKELDEAAMKAVRDAGPYWPLPGDWEKDVLEVKGHFIYLYGGAYVM